MKFIILTIALLSFAITTTAEDQIYPVSLAVSCNYNISNTDVQTGQTFTISRSVINNESYSVTGLYLSDYLPPEFIIQSRQVRINGVDINYSETGPLLNSGVTGYNAFRWVIDDPTYGTPQNYLAAGDVLSTVLTVVCNTAGNFDLDFHTVSGYGNSSPFFSMNTSPISMTVSTVTSVEEELPLPLTTFTSDAYPNPFNGPVTIQFDNARSTEVGLEVYNVTGQKVYQASSLVNSGSGSVIWDALSVGSGLYFYRLYDGEQSSGGKIVLIK